MLGDDGLPIEDLLESRDILWSGLEGLVLPGKAIGLFAQFFPFDLGDRELMGQLFVDAEDLPVMVPQGRQFFFFAHVRIQLEMWSIRNRRALGH